MKMALLKYKEFVNESLNEGSTFDINGTFKSILVDYGDSILIARLDSNEIPSYQSRYLGHIKELTSGTKVTEYIYGENRGYDEVVKENVNKLKSKGSVITKKDGYVVTVSYNSKKIYSNAYLVNVDVSSTQDTSQISQKDVEELERLLTPFNDIFGKSYWVKVYSLEPNEGVIMLDAPGKKRSTTPDKSMPDELKKWIKSVSKIVNKKYVVDWNNPEEISGWGQPKLGWSFIKK